MSCRVRAAVGALLLVLVAVPAAQAHRAGPGAEHSLRAPVTGESFYFVMADRFENGSTANDDGGLGSDPQVSGLDPRHKGYYHGGDLAGLFDKIDYIRDLGTTAIWLTPSGGRSRWPRRSAARGPATLSSSSRGR